MRGVAPCSKVSGPLAPYGSSAGSQPNGKTGKAYASRPRPGLLPDGVPALNLTKIRIQNYRNFEDLEIDFEPNCTIIIGENNSGKTNILEAIYACLRANRLVRQGAFELSDFHLSSSTALPGDSGPIQLTATFAEEQPGTWDVNLVSLLESAINIGKDGTRSLTIQVQGMVAKTPDDGTYDWNFLDGSGKPYVSKMPTLSSRLQSLRPLEYVDAIRDAKRQFSQGSTYFGPFVRDPQFDDTLRELLIENLSNINEKVLESHVVFGVLKENLNAGQNVVQATKVEAARIEAVPSRLSDLLANTQVSFENQDGVPLPLSLHGSGTQSLSVLSLFRAYVAAKVASKGEALSQPILTIEEPESHLHPSGARATWGLLSSFEGQIIATSHSGDLVGEAPLKCLRRITRKKGKLICARVDESQFTEKELGHINYYVRLSRGELFFANSWLLVEGKCELLLLQAIAFAAGINLYAEGIRVIEHSMHGKVLPFIKLADQLGIHWHCICDGDAAGLAYASAARAQLKGRAEGGYISMLDAPNLEVFLCQHGFQAEYLAAVPANQRGNITLSPGDTGYFQQICDNVPDSEKVPTALQVGARIKAIPALLPAILASAIKECKAKG